MRRALTTLRMTSEDISLAFLAIAAMSLTSCSALPSNPREAAEERFSGIGSDETIKLVGTEPFWGGDISSGSFVYSTPENPDGVRIEVKKFAGLSGLGYSGFVDGKAIDLAITVGDCSDGMSDRRFPFTATLKIGEELRKGCAWTEHKPFTGPEIP